MDELSLRNFKDSDFEAFHASMSDFDVVKMTASWPWPPEPAFTKSRMVTRQAKSGQVQVIDLDGEYIGQAAVVRGELGYMLAKPHWGKGIVSWAVKEVLTVAFENTDTSLIKASVWAGNPASEAVLMKFGFVKTGSAEDFCKPRGEICMGSDFELTREAWAACHG